MASKSLEQQFTNWVWGTTPGRIFAGVIAAGTIAIFVGIWVTDSGDTGNAPPATATRLTSSTSAAAATPMGHGNSS